LTGERVTRRLAAILAEDVAGYSRLMGRDEQGTLTSLEPTLARHGGRLVKLTGDGALVSSRARSVHWARPSSFSKPWLRRTGTMPTMLPSSSALACILAT
jgi:class 3 adenylate cyclase